MSECAPQSCERCPAHDGATLKKLGLDMQRFDYVVALAGNPNTGKSTVFNAITGLRQHTGNWPGKTVVRAEGGFALSDDRFKLVDLPGTYSLLSTSPDEEVARDFILFGRPDVTVVVVDANHLERNLNLALQVLAITDRVVLCLNLIDEARRHGRRVDERRLARDIGVPVVPTVARAGEGIDVLLAAVAAVARGETRCNPRRIRRRAGPAADAARRVESLLVEKFPSLPSPAWVAQRLLDGDPRIEQALAAGELQGPGEDAGPVIEEARALRWSVGAGLHDAFTEDAYAEASRLVDRAVIEDGRPRRFDLDRFVDDIVTSRWLGFPIMLGLLAIIFWLTIAGANVPSELLANLLIDHLHPLLHRAGDFLAFPAWLSGLLFDGCYLATAWVVAVMLPPMAIFFPLFTLLEDAGYLARVAFNLDGVFKRVGAHGKQALTMSMGFGCNAAGVVATRIIHSRRERLIAILTNNFSLCNGRWPTQILIATIFLGALVPARYAGLVSAGAVVGVAVLGVAMTFAVSWVLSRTVLHGEPSSFSLELPPYRPPRILRTLYTSLIDRTLIVLWRAVVFALPAGAAIWLAANVDIGGASIAAHLIGWFDPFGALIGLNGVILLAFLVAIPANEIVIPTILMLTVMSAGVAGLGAGRGVMFELDSLNDVTRLLHAGGWTLLTALNLMLFSLLHNPYSTTIYTIWKETRSRKWTTVAALLPLGIGFAVCFVVAQLFRMA